MSSRENRNVLQKDLVTSKRYEIKIPFAAIQLPEIMAWIRQHPELWRQAFPSRRVNNIYFDTYTYTNLKDNVAGVSDRKKLRIRWYGDPINVVEKSQLEIKHKNGFIGWKQIYPIPGEFELSQLSWRQIILRLKYNVKQASYLLCRYPVPTIINTYQRKYFKSLDGELRLTIDTDLQSYSQLASGIPNITRHDLPQPYTILELKTHPGHVERLAQIFTKLNTRVSRFSKYVHAMQASQNS